MRIFLTLLTVLLMTLPLGEAQAGSCYSPVEAEAEQGIRIHSELMVIGLNCQHMGKREGLNLYSQYRQFTADHADLFAAYEDILIKHYKKNGYAKPERQLDTLRTNFGNKISNDVAVMRPDVFCSRYAPRITQAATMKKDDLRRWAAKIHASHPVSKPVCRG